MIIVPLQQLGQLDRAACYNWCTINIGAESPYTWFMAEPTNDGMYEDREKYRQFKDSGCLHCIVFCRNEDAVAFKLRTGV